MTFAHLQTVLLPPVKGPAPDRFLSATVEPHVMDGLYRPVTDGVCDSPGSDQRGGGGGARGPRGGPLWSGQRMAVPPAFSKGCVSISRAAPRPALA